MKKRKKPERILEEEREEDHTGDESESNLNSHSPARSESEE